MPSDDFNRANGSLGSNWTAFAEGAMTIAANHAVGVTGHGGAYWTADTFADDQSAQIALTSMTFTSGQFTGVALRTQNGGLDCYLGLYFDYPGPGPQLHLYKRVAGVSTLLGSPFSCGVQPAGTTIKLVVTGSALSLQMNGVERVAVTDTSIPSGGAAGMMTFDAAEADNWVGGGVVFSRAGTATAGTFLAGVPDEIPGPGVVVSFEDYTPAARYDSVPWTTILIEEAPLVTGDWTLIDTLTITPVDTDPAAPASRSFTTLAGTAADQWYRVIFEDADGNRSLPTTPLENTSAARDPYASTSELASILHVTEAPNTAALTRVLAAAAAEIDSELGRDAPYSSPPALVVEVNLERAVEHWNQMKSPFGIIGLGAESGPAYVARDSFDRHALKLAPLKTSWGVA